ncbi:hypothetical protein PV02_01745 [Methanolobus chelungpuianus]|uniref:Activator of Hsp90 ATPase homologue 1/2-like C-terminal domain-containing protein n=2 Tax=Methanolobus chelungpuianus TaxID=502115 RepID=A0AAE3H9A2_9EURY|nr:hypothetical protein [Methanolobus chelungpuianus]
MRTKDIGEGLVITRTFDVPRARVWKAWTEPEEVKQWWGPKGFTSPFDRIDLRVGGSYLFGMRSPEGDDYWSTGVYREIEPPERIVATDSFADENGKVVPASYYGMSEQWPLEMQATFMFEEQGGKTKLTLSYLDIDNISDTDRENMKQGWNESLDKLSQHLEKTKC